VCVCVCVSVCACYRDTGMRLEHEVRRLIAELR